MHSIRHIFQCNNYMSRVTVTKGVTDGFLCNSVKLSCGSVIEQFGRFHDVTNNLNPRLLARAGR